MSLGTGRVALEPMAGAQDTRTAVTAALGAVEGLSATPYAPDVPAAGCAWPVWAQTTYGGHVGRPPVRTYDVYALLPAGYLPDTVDKADGLVDQVSAALWSVGEVQTAEPVTVQFDDSAAMPGLRFRLVARV